MTLSAVTDHVERGLSYLIEQFKGRPRIEAWISSYLEEVQELSTAAWNVLVLRLIDDAVGEQLTVLGRLVGQERTVEDDERFRVLVRARIAVNLSSGRRNDILRVANLLFGRDTIYTLTPFYPGALILTVVDALDVVPALEHAMLVEATAGGVRIDVHFSMQEQGELFYFGGGNGWGGTGGTGGGFWTGTISEHGVG